MTPPPVLNRTTIHHNFSRTSGNVWQKGRRRQLELIFCRCPPPSICGQFFDCVVLFRNFLPLLLAGWPSWKEFPLELFASEWVWSALTSPRGPCTCKTWSRRTWFLRDSYRTKILKHLNCTMDHQHHHRRLHLDICTQWSHYRKNYTIHSRKDREWQKTSSSTRDGGTTGEGILNADDDGGWSGSGRLRRTLFGFVVWPVLWHIKL